MEAYKKEFYLLDIKYSENDQIINKCSEYIYFTKELENAIKFFNQQQSFPNIIDHLLYTKFDNNKNVKNLAISYFIAIILYKTFQMFENKTLNIFDECYSENTNVELISKIYLELDDVSTSTSPSISLSTSPNISPSTSPSTSVNVSPNTSIHLYKDLTNNTNSSQPLYFKEQYMEFKNNIKFWFIESIKSSGTINYENLYEISMCIVICNIKCQINGNLKDMFM